MLDDYVPSTNRSTATPATDACETVSTGLPSPTKPAATSMHRKVGLADDWGSGSAGLSKETADRIAKRKAEREKAREGNRKAVKLEDIPTFLI
jgi:hypothetical protein